MQPQKTPAPMLVPKARGRESGGAVKRPIAPSTIPANLSGQPLVDWLVTELHKQTEQAEFYREELSHCNFDRDQKANNLHDAYLQLKQALEDNKTLQSYFVGGIEEGRQRIDFRKFAAEHSQLRQQVQQFDEEKKVYKRKIELEHERDMILIRQQYMDESKRYRAEWSQKLESEYQQAFANARKVLSELESDNAYLEKNNDRLRTILQRLQIANSQLSRQLDWFLRPPLRDVTNVRDRDENEDQDDDGGGGGGGGPRPMDLRAKIDE